MINFLELKPGNLYKLSKVDSRWEGSSLLFNISNFKRNIHNEMTNIQIKKDEFFLCLSKAEYDSYELVPVSLLWTKILYKNKLYLFPLNECFIGYLEFEELG